ncbi:MAG: TonB family protein [Sphingomonas sp.]
MTSDVPSASSGSGRPAGRLIGGDQLTITVALVVLALALAGLLTLAIMAAATQASNIERAVRRTFHITSPPPALLANPASRPRVIGNPADWFTNDDYPPSARRAGIEGRVKMRLLIDPDGRVGRCDIVSTSGSAELDAVTCRSAEEKGHFVPAKDQAARAIWSQYLPPAVRWKLEEVTPPGN